MNLKKNSKLIYQNHWHLFFNILLHQKLDTIEKNMKKTLDAIKELNIQAVLVHGNADAGSRRISQIIKNSKIKQYYTLSFAKYVNLLRNSSVLVGNSSSGNNGSSIFTQTINKYWKVDNLGRLPI